MLSDGDETRIRLFRHHSADLETVRPDLKGRYVCPLCLTDFPEEAVIGTSPELTIEDCIPKGLGRIEIVLTCQKCNNTAGTAIDSELHKRLDFESFCKATQQEGVSGRLTYEGLDVGVEVIRTAGATPNMEIRIIEGQSNKDHVRLIQETMAEAKAKGILPKDMKLLLGPRTVPHNPKALTALLKAGYLLFFKAAGYGPLFSPLFDPVRVQIRDWQSNAVNVVSVVFRAILLPPTVCMVKGDPSGIAVPVPLSDAPTIVILPHEDSTYASGTSSAAAIVMQESARSPSISHRGLHLFPRAMLNAPPRLVLRASVRHAAAEMTDARNTAVLVCPIGLATMNRARPLPLENLEW
jgi:hypothetical protein